MQDLTLVGKKLPSKEQCYEDQDGANNGEDGLGGLAAVGGAGAGLKDGFFVKPAGGQAVNAVKQDQPQTDPNCDDDARCVIHKVIVACFDVILGGFLVRNG